MGGVALYTQEKATLREEEIDISNKNMELVCETALAKFNIKSNIFYVLGVYRPPGGQV